MNSTYADGVMSVSKEDSLAHTVLFKSFMGTIDDEINPIWIDTAKMKTMHSSTTVDICLEIVKLAAQIQKALKARLLKLGICCTDLYLQDTLWYLL